MPGKIREMLKNGKAAIGSWLQLPSPDAAEIMATSGYDWLAVDMEHGAFGPGILPDMFRAIRCGGSCPFARLPDSGKVWIKSALESGADGIIFPMIESASQLAEAIDLATYPGQDYWREQGEKAAAHRGVGFCRANGFGKNFSDYMGNIERGLTLVAQIEHIRALETLDAILSHPRLDAIMVGPYDLSGSMGLTGRFDHPDFQKAIAEITGKCRMHSVPMGTHVVSPDPKKLLEAERHGYQFIAYGIDTVFLWEAAARPAVARQA